MSSGMGAYYGGYAGSAAGGVHATRAHRLLPGTRNDHDRVAFGEDEQTVVDVHADVMVFTVTA